MRKIRQNPANFSIVLIAILLGVLMPRGYAKGEQKGLPVNLNVEALKTTFDLGPESPSSPLVKQAITLVFRPSEDLEAPMGIVRSLLAAKTYVDSEALDAAASSRLLTYFDQSGTKLVLLSSDDDGRGFLPEGGESLDENWVFSLTIPSLSDHIFWVVIPKKPSDTRAAYIYGFN